MAKKHSSRRAKKIRNLVAVCSLCAILLTVSTYAWFIGMQTVNVASFDVEIATTEGLYLSVDGEHWYYSLNVKETDAYENNANTWADGGLIPMSTVGDMDADASRMKLYEKASLTATDGGYRLLASRVDNNVTKNAGNEYEEGKGYVAFDLFIKNISGEEYYVENEPLNEEAIYLTTNSEVKVATGGEANTGIENSVRVAFVQIGRVEADTKSVSNITAITCDDKDAASGQVQVTGICRNAQIWEPNDKAHVQNALNWYEESCMKRLEGGTDVTKAASYDIKAETTCNKLALDQAYDTYAVSRELTVDDNVDVYDGTAYNTYTANSNTYAEYTEEGADPADFKLVAFDTFTDTEKNYPGNQRPAFMTLAPNSITKVRVYIYIEGQDVDNYDFASLGKKISVNFGFTKERFTEDDVDHEGPSTDITPEGPASPSV